MKNIEKHIINYLQGELCQNNLIDFENWLSTIDASAQISENQKRFIAYVLANHLVDLQSQNFDFEKAYEIFNQNIGQSNVVKLKCNKARKSMMRYAAILIIALGSSYYIFNQSNAIQLIQVHVPKGEKAELVLPDGTKVLLNSNSILKYPATFKKTVREVYIEGEAFFDVVKNTKKPFIVSLSSNINIKVLGTTFNIKAYPEDSKAETTLFTGKVELTYKEKGTTKSTLLPGDKAVYQKAEGKMLVTTTDTLDDAIAWKNEQLVFKKEALKDIVNALNRFYDANITIQDKSIENQVFTASFNKGVTLQSVLEFLEISGNFKHRKATDKKGNLVLTNTHNLPMK